MPDDDWTTNQRPPTFSIEDWRASFRPIPVAETASTQKKRQRWYHTVQENRPLSTVVFYSPLDVRTCSAVSTALASRRAGPVHRPFGRVRATEVTPVGTTISISYYSRSSSIRSNPTLLQLGFLPAQQGSLISVEPRWSGRWVDILAFIAIMFGLFFGILVGGAAIATEVGEGWFLLAMMLAVAVPAVLGKAGWGWLTRYKPATVNMATVNDVMETFFDAVEVK